MNQPPARSHSSPDGSLAVESHRPLLPVVRNPRVRSLRRWLFAVSTLALVCLALVLAQDRLLRGYAALFRVDDRAPCDAILLLLGGIDYRPEFAAQLFKAGYAPRVVIGNTKKLEWLGESETELTRKRLINLGVDASAIDVMPGPFVESTRDEALRVKQYINARHVESLMIVTVDSHSRRARRIVRRTLKDPKIVLRSASCPHPDYNETNWSKNEQGLLAYFEETIKTVLYYFKY